MGTIQQALLSLPVVGGGFTVPGDPSGPSPTDLSNFQLWLKANNTQFNGVADDTEITGTWNDSSGNSRNGTAVAGGDISTYPKFKQTGGPNSYPAIRMVIATGGRGGHFTLPNFLTGYTAGEFFAVAKLDSDPPPTNAAAPPHGDWGTGSDAYYPWQNDSKIYDDFGTNTRKDAIVTGGGLTSWHVLNIRTASGAWSLWINGVQKHSTGSNTVAWGTSPKIGRNNTVNQKYLVGLICEVFFYSAVLSDSDRWDTVHTYLNNKYGFSLPTS